MKTAASQHKTNLYCPNDRFLNQPRKWLFAKYRDWLTSYQWYSIRRTERYPLEMFKQVKYFNPPVQMYCDLKSVVCHTQMDKYKMYYLHISLE